MYQKPVSNALGLFVLLGAVALLIQPQQIITANRFENQLQEPSRTGAWVDAVIFKSTDSHANAVTQLQADQLDIYAYGISDADLFQTVQQDSDLDYTESMGASYELTFNPAGPNFDDGRLNPFQNYKIREAINWLIDRDHIVRDIFVGLAIPKIVPLVTSFPDYERYITIVNSIETEYAYDPSQAMKIINSEMQNMGATLVDSKWHYNGKPVNIIFLIRVEDQRRQIGDYVADQLEIAGFTVDRQYMTSSEASPIWRDSDPYQGQWHIYTGGWITSGIDRDDGSAFAFYYTPMQYPVQPWLIYEPSPEFYQVAEKLLNINFTTMAERKDLFTQALWYAMDDTGTGSVHVWLVTRKSFYPCRAEAAFASDLADGIAGAQAWPYTVRFKSQEGGSMRIAQPEVLVDPWNPIGGSNWIYDHMPIRATQDDGVMRDPQNGLTWPQRIASATVEVKEGLPVTRTHRWVKLEFSPSITVPEDAWVDWDATNQRFITAGEKFAETQTANVKSIVYYPADLFQTVKWHDGSPLDLSDFVMRMIMAFDPGKPESDIYDESQAWRVEDFLSHFKGVRIISTDPLVIETYDDAYQLDAELNVQTWWPNYTYGPAAWHNLAVGIRAEAAQALAFTLDKADALGIEWMNFIDGNSLGILEGYLSENAASNFIPYTDTLSAYITTEEAQNRWSSLQTWFSNRENFWLGTGPFYLEQISPTLKLHRFASFPDPADKWDFFVTSPSLQMNYSDGAPGSFFNITGDGFPPDQPASISVNSSSIGSVFTSTSGTFAFTLTTASADEGFYYVDVNVNPGATVKFKLNISDPLRPQEGSYTTFDIPAGIAYTHENLLPLLTK